MGVTGKPYGYFLSVPRKFPGCFTHFERKFCFVNFDVAWQASQLPEQRESLFVWLLFSK